MRYKTYQILSGLVNSDDLEDKVNLAREDDWVPVGGIVVTTGKYPQLKQAMTRPIVEYVPIFYCYNCKQESARGETPRCCKDSQLEPTRFAYKRDSESRKIIRNKKIALSF